MTFISHASSHEGPRAVGGQQKSAMPMIAIDRYRLGRHFVAAIAVGASAAIGACARNVERASYRLPESDVVVAVERHSAHAFLAEYHRRAVLEVDRHTVAQIDLLLDAGGLSRTNLYRINDTTLLIRDADASYSIDIPTRTVAQDHTRRKEGTFLGSFDTDSTETWRFIPANERAELPTEFRGG